GSRLRAPPYPRGHDGQRGEDPDLFDDVEGGAAQELDVLAERTIPRMLDLARGPDQPAPEQQVQSRLQVCQIRDGDDQLALGSQDPMQLREGGGLVRVRQVLQYIETEDPCEASGLVGEREQRSAPDGGRCVVLVD